MSFIVLPLVVALALAVDAGLAWVLMLVLHAFGVLLGFWPCFGIVFLASAIFGGGSRARCS